jgi:hypothetical protein
VPVLNMAWAMSPTGKFDRPGSLLPFRDHTVNAIPWHRG